MTQPPDPDLRSSGPQSGGEGLNEAMRRWVRPADGSEGAGLQAARTALFEAHQRLNAERGRVGRVDLNDLTGGNPLALQLLRDVLGRELARVRKRTARSAITEALRELDHLALAQSVETDPAPTSIPEAIAAGAADGPSVPVGPPARQARGFSEVTPPTIPGTCVRRLTPEGIQRAREFLAEMREHPTAPREPPRDLLYDERYSRPFQPDVWIERRPFRTRREAAEYFAPKLAPIRHLVADNAGVWSWLGMFYFADTVRVVDGQTQTPRTFETFVVNRQENRSYMLRYRHYLWGSWRLYETHGESVAFLLDQDLTAFGDIAERAFGSIRIFNSIGIVQLMLRLYISNGMQKRGFSGSPGGLRHLVRVLDQLERTYDVYGMQPEALLRVLPQEFQRWADR